MKLADKVKTKYKFYGRCRYGEVIGIDGAYISVLLKYKGIIIEAYPVELEII